MRTVAFVNDFISDAGGGKGSPVTAALAYAKVRPAAPDVNWPTAGWRLAGDDGKSHITVEATAPDGRYTLTTSRLRDGTWQVSSGSACRYNSASGF